MVVSETKLGVTPVGMTAGPRFPFADVVREVAADFHRRGWAFASSGNYSVVLGKEPLRLLITASGKYKDRLGAGDFLILDAQGRSVEPTVERPSAETALHLMLAQRPGVGAVLHTHSVWNTILSEVHGDNGGLMIQGFEMLKGLSGVTTHEHQEWVPIYPNTQDITALARDVALRLDDPAVPGTHGLLIRRHGLYTWGRDLDEARRHVETFEFLFEVLGRSSR